MRRFTVAFSALSTLLLACSGNHVAGSKGGSETTNGVTACIRRGDGTPAAGSIVRLRRADYVSRPAALGKRTLDSIDVVTDPQGRFLITNVTPGAYCIEVNDTATGAGRGGAILLTCTVDTCDTFDLETVSLHPYAVITGLVDTEGVGGRRFYAQVRGLERLAQVGAAGSFAFHDLPGGRLDVRIVDNTAAGAARELLNVTASPGDTVAVRVSRTAAFSGHIYLDTIAAAVPLTAAITGFPLLVRLDSSTFDFTRALPRGDDIRFTKADGTPLPHEIEQWDSSAQNAAIWVGIDTVHGNSTEQHIIMEWGDSNADSRSNGAAVFDTAQGFAGVWHLNENPESGADAVKDRTPNGFNGTPRGSMTSGNVVPGMVGAAFRFNGNDDYIAAGTLNVSGSYTLSCWIHADDLNEAARRFIWKEYSYTLWYDAIGGGIRVEHFTDSLVWRGIYQDNSRLLPLNADTWYHLAGTYDGDKIILFINGEPVDSTQTIGVNPHSSQHPLSLGGRSDEFVKGIMDEVRIENRARSAEWIRMCYRNQRQNGIVSDFRR
ncbi:MAG: DUF2341 domain-containing protein [Chitinispirillaceae bacterium]|nr:DUF2341 domain-containing protein [Chitinispirillaceae bacterium]